MLFGLVVLAVGFLGLVESQDSKPCEFNKKCLCIKESENVYDEVSCLNVTKVFPKFNPVPEGTKVRKFVISGHIEEMPQTGFDQFSRVEHLQIEFTNGPASFRVEDKGKATLANSSIGRLSLIGFRKLPPLTKSPRAIDEKTLANLEILSIEKSDIDLDDDEAFKGATSLKALSLRNNGITDTTIADEVHPFKSVADTLIELDLSNNAIQSYSYWKAALEDLNHLQILLLNRNILQDLKGSDFTKFPNLRLLDLSSNLLLTKFEDSNIPAIHSALMELDLDDCRLTEFPAGALKNAPNLEKLRLSNNRIDKLTPADFFNATTLNTLNLEGNPILTIEPGTFSDLVSLKNFTIKDWDFDVLDLSVFGSGLESLQVVDNGRLQIIKLSDNASMPLNLRHLEISGNNLSVIHESVKHLLQTDALTISISNEHSVHCPVEEPAGHSVTTTAPDSDNGTVGSTDATDNSTHAQNETATITSTVPSTITTTSTPQHPNATHSLMWLARLAVCTNKIHLADNVFCEDPSGGNSTKTTLFDFLASMNPDCTGLPGRTTTPGPNAGRPGGAAGRGAAASNRLLDSVFPVIASLLIFMLVK